LNSPPQKTDFAQLQLRMVQYQITQLARNCFLKTAMEMGWKIKMWNHKEELGYGLASVEYEINGSIRHFMEFCCYRQVKPMLLCSLESDQGQAFKFLLECNFSPVPIDPARDLELQKHLGSFLAKLYRWVLEHARSQGELSTPWLREVEKEFLRVY
jgi:hypothetical protein